MPTDCPFCDLPSDRVLFREGPVLAVWDRFPVSPGHLLVITARHVASWFEASDEEQQAALIALRRAEALLREEHSAVDFNGSLRFIHGQIASGRQQGKFFRRGATTGAH